MNLQGSMNQLLAMGAAYKKASDIANKPVPGSTIKLPKELDMPGPPRPSKQSQQAQMQPQQTQQQLNPEEVMFFFGEKHKPSYKQKQNFGQFKSKKKGGKH